MSKPPLAFGSAKHGDVPARGHVAIVRYRLCPSFENDAKNSLTVLLIGRPRLTGADHGVNASGTSAAIRDGNPIHTTPIKAAAAIRPNGPLIVLPPLFARATPKVVPLRQEGFNVKSRRAAEIARRRPGRCAG